MVRRRRKSSQSLEPMVLKLLRKLLKHFSVKGLVFTSCGKRTVRGIVVTKSPKEAGEVAHRFEVGGFKGRSVGYLSVDGKRLFPDKTQMPSRRNVRR